MTMSSSKHYRLRFKNSLGDSFISKQDLLEALEVFDNQIEVGEYFGVNQMTISRANRKLGINYDCRHKANKKRAATRKIKKVSKLNGKPSWNSGTAMTKKCEICGKEYKCLGKKRGEKRRFCSRKCTAIYFKEAYKGDKFSGKNNPNYGNDKLKQAWKRGCYKDRSLPEHSFGKRTMYNGTNYRSTWEAQYAKFLDDNKIEFTFEKHRFHLRDGTFYIPDFYLPEYDLFIEVKGWWTPRAKKKFCKVKTQHSGKKILVERDNKQWKLKSYLKENQSSLMMS